MSKLLILFLISLLFASSLAEENSRMLGNKWSSMPTTTTTVTPFNNNVAVTVEAGEAEESTPVNLGTTITTKTWENPDGSHVKQVITVEKTCLNGMVTTKTTTKTYTYTNVSTHQETETTEAAEESQGENVVVAVHPQEENNSYPTEEAECETTTMAVTEAEHNSENVVVTVEAGEAEENTPVNLGTTTVTKTWENADGSHVKQVIVIQKTCLNGLITTKTTTTTYTYTNVSTSTHTEEAEAVESEHEVEVSVEAPENVQVEVALEHEYESEYEHNVEVVEESEAEAEECVVKILPTTITTKSWDNANGSHVVQVITCEKTCCNGIITIKTTTKTYTYTNVIVHHEEEVQVEAAEESQGENVIVVVHPQEESTSYPMEEAECETKTTIETETEHNTSENVAVEVEVEGEHAEESEECVVKILPTIIKTKTWTNPDGSHVKQVITCERTSCNGVITIKTITKTYTWPAASMETEMTSAGEESSNNGKKW